MTPTSNFNLITVDDLSNFAPELAPYIANYQPETVSGMISQASRTVLGICQVKGFDRRTVTDEGQAQISNEGDLVLTVAQFPLASPQDVQKVVLTKGGFQAALTLTDQTGASLFQVPDPGWRFKFPNSYFYLTGTYLAGGSSQLLTLKGAHVLYQMTYTGGFTAIPDDIKRATVLIIRDIMKYTINPFGAMSWKQGTMAQEYKGKSPMRDEAESILYAGGYVRTALF